MLRIGVDGGGTTTRAVLVNDHLEVVGRGEAGASNHYSVGPERAVENIARAVDGALHAAGAASGDVAGWGLGLAGACTPAEQAMIRARLLPLTAGRPLVVDEDQAASQMGAFGGGPGAVCGAGTGAYCFGINERGERGRADGLGPLLGDRGSGYWVGEAALRALCRANDGSGPATSLLDGCLAQLQVNSVDGLVQLVYSPNFERDRIAALFPMVLHCAAAGDEVAQGLLEAAGKELAATTGAVMTKLGVNRVAVSGGVISRESPVRASFEAALSAMVRAVQVQEPQYDAGIGAALLVAAH